MRGLIAAVLFATAAISVRADDFVVSEGPLSDDDFYRAVACGAPVGGDCDVAMRYWPPVMAANLHVVLAPVPDDYSRGLRQILEAALPLAIDKINQAGAGVHLTRVEGPVPAEITIYFTPAKGDEPIRGTGDPAVDGLMIPYGRVVLRQRGEDTITRAAIIIAGDVPQIVAHSTLLEELIQSLGLIRDIRNSYYQDISIFSEDNNRMLALGEQDMMALRRHYPND